MADQTMEHAQPLTLLAEDERLFRDSVREFADRHVRPLVRDMDEQAKIPRSLVDRLFDLGGMAIEIPEAYGGGAAGPFFPPLPVAEPLRGDPPGGAYALSGAGSGSDAFALTTRAREGTDAEGEHYRLTGRKLWITNGNEADIFLVFATLNPDAGYRGITAFVIERGCHGFTVGKKEDKLGIRASSTCELIFDDCRVPKANVLGETGKGYKAAIETLNEGRIGIGAQMIGLAAGALEHAIAYTKERKQFGKPIAEFQAVQHQLARAAMEVEAARLTVYNAARLRDAGRPFLTEAAICKIFSSEVAERVSSLAVNLFGGNGFVEEYPVEKLYRDAKIGQIYEGTSNLQLQTIAKQILG